MDVNSTKLNALKSNFNDYKERAYMSLKTQVELESWIKLYERLYKKHVILESELAEEKAKRKVIRVFKTDLDNKKNENLLKKKVDK